MLMYGFSAIGYSHFMLMYAFQPCSAVDVTIDRGILESTCYFLKDINQMLLIAKENVMIFQDRS